MEASNVVIMEPPEARKWPLARIRADGVQPGDYLIRLGSFEKVTETEVATDYAWIQTKKADYTSSREAQYWILMKPRDMAA